jgi:cytochrome b561
MSLANASLPSAAIGAHLPVARILHWLIAFFVFAMFASGIIMKQLSGGLLADWLYSAHKLCGMLVLGLLVLRLAYRLFARFTGRWQKTLGGRHLHRLIYAVAILTPMLGWAAVSDFGARKTFFGISLPEILPKGLGYADTLFLAHAIAAFALLALAFWHVGAALQDYVMRGSSGKTD